MKKLKIAFLFIFLLTASPAFSVEDAIVAVVNDELITLSDLREYIKKTYISLVAEGKSDREIQQIMQDMETNGINNLIEDKIILSKANTLGLEIREKLVEDRIKDIKKRYTSEEEFLQALVKAGASMTDLRNRVVEQLKIRYTIEHEINDKIVISPKEITDFYQKNIDKFHTKEKIYLDSIYFPYEKDKELALKNANVALELIKNGEDFFKVSKDYSQSPSIGLVERGQLLPEIEKNVFHLVEGNISDVVQTENGAYIFRVKAKYPAQLASLGDVKDEIRDIIFKQKFQESFLTWITRLKKEAYVEIKQ
jgi:parvulin-like peptidyl-prolyl isomerase